MAMCRMEKDEKEPISERQDQVHGIFIYPNQHVHRVFVHPAISPRLAPVSNVIFCSKTDILSKIAIYKLYFEFSAWTSERIEFL